MLQPGYHGSGRNQVGVLSRGNQDEMSTLLRKVLNRAGPKYIQFADRVISSHVGGDSSPAFYDVQKTYPQLLTIDREYETVWKELRVLLPKKESIRLVHETITAHPVVPGWRVLWVYFRNLNQYLPNRELFPETFAVLNQIPHMVDAWFSIIEPRKSIPAHRGMYRGLLRYHIAFKVPDNNPPKLRVKNEYYTWKQGESVMFDDRHEHEVYNESDDYRVVLIVDVLRPLPWPLHMMNVVAIWCIAKLHMEPAIANKTLTLQGDAFQER